MATTLAHRPAGMQRPLEPLAVEADAITKGFQGRTVVDQVSFSLRRGETLGLVGPNGSGKTTTIRMILDIVRPDSGRIMVLGSSFSDAIKDRVGYLPEERGLYRSVTVERALLYLASLKSIGSASASVRIEELLRRVGLWQHRSKKVGELSRGMSQLIGFCAAILHHPDLLILDEPFSGLDPLNVKVMKDLVVDIGATGTATIFSTHQMEDVEELCQRVLMIYQGHRVLYGGLNEIKAQHGMNSILVEHEGQLGSLTGVEQVVRRGASGTELRLKAGADPQTVLRELVDGPTRVRRFELAAPTLNEIFISVAESWRPDSEP